MATKTQADAELAKAEADETATETPKGYDQTTGAFNL